MDNNSILESLLKEQKKTNRRMGVVVGTTVVIGILCLLDTALKGGIVAVAVNFLKGAKGIFESVGKNFCDAASSAEGNNENANPAKTGEDVEFEEVK